MRYIALIPNPEGPRNLSGLIENAVRREIRRLQDEFNDGHAFPGPPRRAATGPARRLLSPARATRSTGITRITGIHYPAAHPGPLPVRAAPRVVAHGKRG